MVAFASTPDLRPALVRSLMPRLIPHDLLPSTTMGICAWLLQHEHAIAEIDAGQCIIVATPVAFFPTLFTRDGAEHTAATAKIDAIGIDLAPLLASVRAAIAEAN